MGFSRQEYWSGVPSPSLPQRLLRHLQELELADRERVRGEKGRMGREKGRMREGVGREGRSGKEGDPEEETKDGRKGGKEETERGREEGKEAGREKERKKGEGRGRRKQRKRRISTQGAWKEIQTAK